MKNKHCYSLQYLHVKNGIFDSVIDACYILYLSGNEDRYEKMMKQINELSLCKRTILCHNYGYKKCNKVLKNQKSTYDLVDAYMYVLEDAIHHNYDQICILEDDFIYEDSLFHPQHQKCITSYLDKSKSSCKTSDYVYSLGSLPYLQSFYLFDMRHTHIYLSTGTHAMIYSKKAMKNIYENREKIDDIDLYLNQHYFYKKYGYTTPLITQTFPETENSKHWGSHLRIDGYKYMKYMFQLFRLQESTIHYKTFFILSILLFYVISNLLFFTFQKWIKIKI